ncbi:hypothetical protein VP01_884g1 [Puccinia sorghi]|uniref:Uncharacterized protein n=1 Tax=Puccinia sorghi TaxID=27349 RepID=A0A0L6U8A2_9BASI|nr:hypothetical protein VP01_884g1 [Puccinia sorghi]
MQPNIAFLISPANNQVFWRHNLKTGHPLPLPLTLYVVLFVSWRHLFCHASQENCKIAIKIITKIFSVALTNSGSLQNLGAILHNPRTLIKKAKVEVKLLKSICCRITIGDTKTFVWNSLVSISSHSVWNSLVSISLSAILTWIKWLLSKPNTKREINNWTQVNQVLHNLGYISDVQHGKNFCGMKIQTHSSWESLCLLTGSIGVETRFGNKVSHLCLAGIPGPFSPDPSTINHLLRPLVNKLINLENGILIPTHQFPAGQVVQVKLLALFGDVLATKKVASFASHSETKFCSFCHASHTNIPQSQLSKPCEKGKKKASAKQSRTTTSAFSQDQILKKTGVRWSKLNRLAYWDPIHHVVLGIIQNWLDCILQDHFFYCWRFWAKSTNDASKKRKGEMPGTYPNKRTRLIDGAIFTMEIDEDSLSGESDEYDELIEYIILNGVLTEAFSPWVMSSASQKKMEIKCIWLAQFVFIIPVVIPEIYNNHLGKIDLCSNLSKQFKPGNLKRFETHYKKYSDGVGEPFEEIKVQSNHCFSLHIPQQMDVWGPLVGVSEFAGERLIGFFQKIKTNHQIVFKLGKTTWYGMVKQVYQYTNHLGEQKAVVFISKITNIYPKQLEDIPTRPFLPVVPIWGCDKGIFSIDENGFILFPHACDAFININGQPK